MRAKYFLIVVVSCLASPMVFAAGACNKAVAAYYLSNSQPEYSANGEKALRACAGEYPNFPRAILSACDHSSVDIGRNLQALQCKLDAYQSLGNYFL